MKYRSRRGVVVEALPGQKEKTPIASTSPSQYCCHSRRFIPPQIHCIPRKYWVFSWFPVLSRLIPPLSNTLSPYILGHTPKGAGISLGIHTNLQSVTAQYVDVRLDRKKTVLGTYHKALQPQKEPVKPSKPANQGKKKSSEM